MGKQIFLSYSRRDSDFAHRLAHDLEQYGFDAWIDRSDIQAGEAWRKSIVQGITTSDAFVIILSPNSITSRNVVKELSIAEDRHLRLFPVIFQPCDIPAEMEYQLTGLQYIDFATDGYPAALEKLVNALRGTKAPDPPPSRPQPQPPQPPQPTFQLPGTWQVTIGHPLTGVVMGYGQFTFTPAGEFWGELNTPNGPMRAQGRYQLVGQQLFMQGGHAYAAMPFHTMPYSLALQITGAVPNRLNAVSTAGEQIVLERVA